MPGNTVGQGFETRWGEFFSIHLIPPAALDTGVEEFIFCDWPGKLPGNCWNDYSNVLFSVSLLKKRTL
jgi:hypothetical protein